MNPSEAARQVGLNAPRDSLVEVDASVAQSIVRVLLTHDVAYNGEIMGQERAAELADQFVRASESERTRYFTNGNWDVCLGEVKETSGFRFMGFTNATFDGGVIAVDDTTVRCVWFEDED